MTKDFFDACPEAKESNLEKDCLLAVTLIPVHSASYPASMVKQISPGMWNFMTDTNHSSLMVRILCGTLDNPNNFW